MMGIILMETDAQTAKLKQVGFVQNNVSKNQYAQNFVEMENYNKIKDKNVMMEMSILEMGVQIAKLKKDGIAQN